MRRASRTTRALAVFGIAAVLGFGYYLQAEPGRVPRLSANLEPLAETPLEGYCSGWVFWENFSNRPDEEAMKECLEHQPVGADRWDTYSNEVDLSRVVISFCQGAADAGFDGSVTLHCKKFIDDERYWPTLWGTLTNAFNRNYPYPGDTFVAPPSGGRGSEREGTERDGFVRGAG